MSDINLGRVKGDKIIVNATEPTTRKDGTKLLTGDLWINTSTYQVWEYNGTAFVDTGMNIKGEKGDKGNTGATPNLEGFIKYPILLPPDSGLDLSTVLSPGCFYTEDVRDKSLPGVIGVPNGLEKYPLSLEVFKGQNREFYTQRLMNHVNGDMYIRTYENQRPTGDWKKIGDIGKSLYKADCHIYCGLRFASDWDTVLLPNLAQQGAYAIGSLKFSIFFDNLDWINNLSDNVKSAIWTYPNTDEQATVSLDHEDIEMVINILSTMLRAKKELGIPEPESNSTSISQTNIAKIPFAPVNGDISIFKKNTGKAYTKVVPIGFNYDVYTNLPFLVCQCFMPDDYFNPTTEYKKMSYFIAHIANYEDVSSAIFPVNLPNGGMVMRLAITKIL